MRNKIYNILFWGLIVLFFFITYMGYSLFFKQIIPANLDMFFMSDDGALLSDLISFLLTVVLFGAAYGGVKYYVDGYKEYDKNVLLIDKYFGILKKIDSMEKIEAESQSEEFSDLSFAESKVHIVTDLLTISLFLQSIYIKMRGSKKIL